MIPYKDVQGVMNLRLIYIYLDYRTLRHFYRKVLVLLTFESTSFLWHYFMVARSRNGRFWHQETRWVALLSSLSSQTLGMDPPEGWELDSIPSFSILKDGGKFWVGYLLQIWGWMKLMTWWFQISLFLPLLGEMIHFD